MCSSKSKVFAQILVDNILSIFILQLFEVKFFFEFQYLNKYTAIYIALQIIYTVKRKYCYHCLRCFMFINVLKLSGFLFIIGNFGFYVILNVFLEILR